MAFSAKDMSRSAKIGMVAGLFAVCLIGVLITGPIPQDPLYHLFADTRSCLGIPNFGDVSSNAGFALVGLWGLWVTLRRLGLGGGNGGGANGGGFERRGDAVPYLIFFLSVALVAPGSAYYHLDPDNPRLFWDRLPITLAFMALFPAILADRVARNFSLRLLLPAFLVLGLASLYYWLGTELAGEGDLRYYILVQLYPMVALPVVCLLFPNARYSGGGYLIWMYLWYGVAKVLEFSDRAVFDLLGGLVSGHTLKHLAATLAAAVVVRMLAVNTRPARA